MENQVGKCSNVVWHDTCLLFVHVPKFDYSTLHQSFLNWMVIMAEIAFTTINFLCVTWPMVPVPGAKLNTEAGWTCRVCAQVDKGGKNVGWRSGEATGNDGAIMAKLLKAAIEPLSLRAKL